MNLILDAHAFLWFIAGDDRLTANARAAIQNTNNQVFVSAATLWEIAIKASLGRLQLALPFEELITEQIRLNGFRLLSIAPQHLHIVASLPFHHRDPFDRLLVAQAIIEALTIVSADSALDLYGVERLW